MSVEIPRTRKIDPVTGARCVDGDAIAGRVRAARRDRKTGKVSRPYRDAVKADKQLSRAAHRLARAAAEGLGTYREEQQTSAGKKRNGRVRDAPLNAAKGTAEALRIASTVPVDLVRAMRTRRGGRVLRGMARRIFGALDPR
jgi:hypothetical protein